MTVQSLRADVVDIRCKCVFTRFLKTRQLALCKPDTVLVFFPVIPGDTIIRGD